MNLQTRRVFVASVFATLALATATVYAAPQRYRLTVLQPVAGATRTSAVAINNLGQVIVQSDNNRGSYVWQRGKLTLFGTPSEGLRAEGINDRGWITGAVGDYPILYRDGRYDTFVNPFAGFGPARGVDINDHGVIVGVGVDYESFPESYGFVIRDGVTVGVPGTSTATPFTASAINNRNQVVGTAGFGRVIDDEFEAGHAFVFQRGNVIDIHRGTEGTSRAMDINDKGHVVGELILPNQIGRAFLYRDGVMKDLGTLGDPASWGSTAYGINEAGVVVGQAFDYSASRKRRAFVYSGGRMYDLNYLTQWRGGFELQEARAINDHGKIVGNGRYGRRGEVRAFLLRPIPEALTQDTAHSPD
jgi:probable HAF family extracellular repeat protein